MPSTPPPPPAGIIAWADLTVPDARRLRDFYQAVCNWTPQPVTMGDYEDYSMLPPGSEKPAAGVCHARGENAQLPPQWLIYVPVENLSASVDACKKLGGKIIAPVPGGFVLQDPAGAVMAIVQR